MRNTVAAPPILGNSHAKGVSNLVAIVQTLACPPPLSHRGVEALAQAGVPDVRTNPGDAACTSCHDIRMQTTTIRETAGSWCCGPNTSHCYGGPLEP